MLSSFFKRIRRIWSIPTLRDRIGYTFLMFLVVRAGVHMPLPGVDLIRIKNMAKGGFVDFVNLISGGAFSKASIFTLGIAPYISASIIMYVLTLAYPKLEQMQREGGKEKEKITQWTRYLGIGISLFQSILAITFLQMNGYIEAPSVWFYLNTMLILTTSVTFLTWVGDQITTNGIGNGISLIIFVGIVARIPTSAISLFRSSSSMNFLIIELIFISLLSGLMIAAIVAFQLATRKVPVIYASGKGKSIATKSFIPMKINNSGVMPIIFSNLIASIPSTVVFYLPESWDLRLKLMGLFSSGSLVYNLLYFALVLLFTFFYTSVVFDPEKIADNLRKSGASIPGVRPGSETVAHLESIIVRITFGGAVFLATIAILPYVLSSLFGASFSIGGTGIIIAVGVAIETLQQIEGALSMEEYQSFI
ncbi:MAG TPA: preprotein translocase subunit SecY [Fusobacteria bacterium]|nr:preprotein translocase subunit SecY [Fusobacteriota bacterium]|tara:strand:- start:83 stop:1345 length:1263 start_codon:yes stop_codon:yes gene_type:complete